MLIRPINVDEKDAYNAVVSHPLQSYEWGQFRQKEGQHVERIGMFDNGALVGAFQVSFHHIPHTSYTVGYVPKGMLPDETLLRALTDIGTKRNALFIKLEPNVSTPFDKPDGHTHIESFLLSHNCVLGKQLFTKYTFMLDLHPTEEELLSSMHSKTRYNINLAQKKGVQVVEDSTQSGLEEYFTLLFETTKRQGFYAHNKHYFQNMWDVLQPAGIAHLFKAVYQGKTLGCWIVFVFNKTLYYPYGASSREFREVMANNLLAWEVIRYGKNNGCTKFDMWGALGPNPNPKDPWYGFHKFKEGYGGVLTQSIGTYDLVLQPNLYGIFLKLDALRWVILRIKSKLGL